MAEEEKERVLLDRTSRATRGKRMTKLLDEELEQDEQFWNQEALKDEEDDDNYQDEGEAADVYDSDFDESDKQIIDELANHLKGLMNFFNSNIEQIHNDHSENKSSDKSEPTIEDKFHYQQLQLLDKNLERIFIENNENQRQRSHHHPIPDFTSPPMDFSEYMALVNSFSSHSSFLGQNPNSNPNSN